MVNRVVWTIPAGPVFTDLGEGHLDAPIELPYTHVEQRAGSLSFHQGQRTVQAPQAGAQLLLLDSHGTVVDTTTPQELAQSLELRRTWNRYARGVVGPLETKS